MLVIYPDWRFLQIQLTMIMALFVTCYTAVTRPFEEPVLNKQEVVNELMILLSTYMLYAYTDIIGDLG